MFMSFCFPLLTISLTHSYHSFSHQKPITFYLAVFFSMPLSLRHRSEGTRSIVIGLQSWQPYDWAGGYCNWIRLEISSVPVRLLKSQSVVYGRRLPFTLSSVSASGSRLSAVSEWRSLTRSTCDDEERWISPRAEKFFWQKTYFRAIIKRSWNALNVCATNWRCCPMKVHSMEGRNY